MLHARIYRKSYIETGKKDEDTERAWPRTPKQWLKSQRDITTAKSLLRSSGSQPHARTPNPGHQDQEVEPAQQLAVKISGTLSTRMKRESVRVPGALLKGQPTGACSRALTRGSSRGKATQGIYWP